MYNGERKREGASAFLKKGRELSRVRSGLLENFGELRKVRDGTLWLGLDESPAQWRLFELGCGWRVS